MSRKRARGSAPHQDLPVAPRTRGAAALPGGPAPAVRLRRRIAYAQNFLATPLLADHLLDVSSIGSRDVVYEIGPGEGVITDRLAERCQHVVTVEQDPRLVGRLRRRFAGRANVTVFEHDFRRFPLPVTPYKVFANVPFNITAAVVAKLTGAVAPPNDIYLTVQREAAARYVGRPEAPRETLAAALLKPWFEPTIVHRFQRADFEPAPGVDVVMLRLRKRGPPLLTSTEAQPYRDLVTACFTAWQPDVGRALAEVLDRRRLGKLRRELAAATELHGDAASWYLRPSELPFEAWLVLYRRFRRIADGATWQRLAGAEARLRQQQARLQKLHRTRVRPPPVPPLLLVGWPPAGAPRPSLTVLP